MADTIFLATDGSEDAHAASERAVGLAGERDASLYVVCVADRRQLSEPTLSSMEYQTIRAKDHGHECVTEVSRMAEEAGMGIEGSLRHAPRPGSGRATASGHSKIYRRFGVQSLRIKNAARSSGMWPRLSVLRAK